MRKKADPVSFGSTRFLTVDHGGFLVTDAWFSPNLVLQPHLHDRTILAITLSGVWDSLLDRTPRLNRAGRSHQGPRIL